LPPFSPPIENCWKAVQSHLCRLLDRDNDTMREPTLEAWKRLNQLIMTKWVGLKCRSGCILVDSGLVELRGAPVVC
jgi:hypothetical protein